MGGKRQKLAANEVEHLVRAAMDVERKTMELYCKFESLFPEPEELRSFWFDMAQHESRHFGALALVSGLLRGRSHRALGAAHHLDRAHIAQLRRRLLQAHRQADRGLTIKDAFAIALDIESSEVENVVLDLIQELRGDRERERAVRLLLHDLGDLAYMVEKYADDSELLARADALLERQVERLRSESAADERGSGDRRRHQRSGT